MAVLADKALDRARAGEENRQRRRQGLLHTLDLDTYDTYSRNSRIMVVFRG